MRPLSSTVRAQFTIVLACAVLPAAITLRAGQAPAAGQGAAPAARPLVPLTAASVARDLTGHLGKNASMMAAVEASLSKTVFIVDQDKARTADAYVIVIAPSLQSAPAAGAYVTVQGEVMRFDPDEIAKKARGYTLDLPADVVAKYRGRPAVLATAVLTSDLVDLAKRPIPPPTPDDVALTAHMRAINPAFTAIRGGLDTPDAAQLQAQLATIRKAFTESETVFKARALADAVKWSADALALVTAMERSVSAAKFEDLKASAGSLQQVCAACHNARRERMDDGTYRLKSGG